MKAEDKTPYTPNPYATALALGREIDDLYKSRAALVAALDQINVAACYASEEDPGAALEVLRHIGALARAALSQSRGEKP
jgi:hypothetical protein